MGVGVTEKVRAGRPVGDVLSSENRGSPKVTLTEGVVGTLSRPTPATGVFPVTRLTQRPESTLSDTTLGTGRDGKTQGPNHTRSGPQRDSGLPHPLDWRSTSDFHS